MAHTSSKVSRIIALTSLLVAAVATSTIAEPSAVDPQTLIGEWQGTGKAGAGTTSVRYYLTITKVDGTKVEGKMQPVGNRPFPAYDIYGVIEGNVLKYHDADKDITAELVVDGRSMKGTGFRASTRSGGDIELVKK